MWLEVCRSGATWPGLTHALWCCLFFSSPRPLVFRCTPTPTQRHSIVASQHYARPSPIESIKWKLWFAIILINLWRVRRQLMYFTNFREVKRRTMTSREDFVQRTFVRKKHSATCLMWVHWMPLRYSMSLLSLRIREYATFVARRLKHQRKRRGIANVMYIIAIGTEQQVVVVRERPQIT